MTIEQVDEAINARKLASTTLNEQLIAIEEDNKQNMTAAEIGRQKHRSLLPLGLQKTSILMKGLLEHEQIMNELLCRKNVTPVVLWPDKKSKRASTTISDLKRIIADNSSGNQNEGSNHGGIVIISIEGTWNTARKMVNKLPPHVLRLDLSDEIRLNFTTPEMNEGIFIDNSVTTAGVTSQSTSAPSLLSPLRRQGKELSKIMSRH
ncbi:hypothetical protein QTG54_002895 [Skeletonema marinoi]|uniref:tRNA-uridine aminocarboxypropyltransferase n=1 Tax=Skeletonema marinoi TaxID=267567 RepID=A0AAD8YHA9_9STRA|nr:hypothetical protein QTG54_002895 [Skeletonema marinoi]